MFSYFQAVCNLFSKLFEWRATETEHECETDIIKDKRDYKKATNIAEKIISIAVRYKDFMSWNDRRLLTKYINKFNKVN